eukprot:4266891-Amphidinium_carterae.1
MPTKINRCRLHSHIVTLDATEAGVMLSVLMPLHEAGVMLSCCQPLMPLRQVFYSVMLSLLMVCHGHAYDHALPIADQFSMLCGLMHGSSQVSLHCNFNRSHATLERFFTRVKEQIWNYVTVEQDAIDYTKKDGGARDRP